MHTIASFQIDDPGLGSGVVPKGSKSAGPRADDKTEAFLKDVTETLLDSQRGDKWKDFGSDRMGRLQGLADRSKHSDCVVVPTDKTNSFVTMEAVEYARCDCVSCCCLPSIWRLVVCAPRTSTQKHRGGGRGSPERRRQILFSL